MQTTTTIPSRAAGVLLPVSSLPGPYGIGSFGAAARRWVSFLQQAGQRYWQVLPLGPTGFGDSPYQSVSAFAGNPYFIDLDTLCEEGLLREDEYKTLPFGTQANTVDYSALYQHREGVLRRAFARFTGHNALDAFCAEHAWMPDYTLFMAIKAKEGQRPLTQWPPAAQRREAAALAALREELAEDIRYHAFVQYLFFGQWNALRQYAATHEVQIIGDIPIYVSGDSADLWADNSLFEMDENALPTEVAGCPPDSFAPDGQLWGNPLYNWEALEKAGYGWWIQRMHASFTMYDVLRIDHFRGLESYYAIPFGAENARQGRWRKGPGMKLINAIEKGVPAARIIAEDLGFLTDEVRQLLQDSGYPGMKVLQFAFDTREAGDYSPYNYGKNNVVYTGTHDNDTVRGWAKTAAKRDIANALEYLGVSHKCQLPRAFVRLAMQSPAALAVVPMQDWLALPASARINTPGTLGGRNWRWRLQEKALTPRMAAQMHSMAQIYGRAP